MEKKTFFFMECKCYMQIRCYLLDQILKSYYNNDILYIV